MSARRSSRLAAKPAVSYTEIDDETLPQEVLAPAERYVKLLTASECHRGFQFKTGLNILQEPWNPDPHCGPGGIYFCKMSQVFRWLHLYKDLAWVRWVELPADAQIVDCEGAGKQKADKVILSERMTIQDFLQEYFDADELCDLANCAFDYVKQTPELCMKMIKKNPAYLQSIREQTPELCQAAIELNAYSIAYVRDQTPELCELALKKDLRSIRDIRGLTPESAENAVKVAPSIIMDLPNQLKTPEVCMLAVQKNGHMLLYVPQEIKTYEICLAAVKQCGQLFVNVPSRFHTPELCMAAVQQNGYTLGALRWAAAQAPEICMAAVKQHGCALQFVQKKTPELCMAAVEQNGYALRHVPKELQTREMCDIAVAGAKHAAKYVLI